MEHKAGSLLRSIIPMITAIIISGAAGLFIGRWLVPARGSGEPVQAAASQDQQASDQRAGKVRYRCGMHPWVISDKPGNCPICGMKLEPFIEGAAAAATAGTPPPGTITIDPWVQQNMNLRTEYARTGRVVRSVYTVGTIQPAEDLIVDISLKVSGWVEKLYVDRTGDWVEQGQPLLDIYSPELYSAQVEYLSALKSAEIDPEQAQTVLESIRERFRNWDIPPQELQELERTRTVHRLMTIRSPISGYVLEKPVFEGQHVMPEKVLMRIAPLDRVWAYGEVYEQDLGLVRQGQEVHVESPYMPGLVFTGRVDYVYPTVNPRTRTGRLRVVIPNQELALKPDMYVQMQIMVERSGYAVLVPATAVVRTGKRNTVFVALGNGMFEARAVVPGITDDSGWTEILQGIRPGERVVVSGQFMLDSESQLNEAVLRLTHAHGDRMQPSKSTQQPADQTQQEATHLEHEAAHEPLKLPPGVSMLYTCPMEVHAHVVSDRPGRCPECEMDLVPITTVAHGRIALEHWLKEHGRSSGQTTPMSGKE